MFTLRKILDSKLFWLVYLIRMTQLFLIGTLYADSSAYDKPSFLFLPIFPWHSNDEMSWSNLAWSQFLFLMPLFLYVIVELGIYIIDIYHKSDRPKMFKLLALEIVLYSIVTRALTSNALNAIRMDNAQEYTTIASFLNTFRFVVNSDWLWLIIVGGVVALLIAMKNLLIEMTGGREAY